MFYTTVWVGEIFKRSQPVMDPPINPTTIANEATRAGSRALFGQALVSFMTSIILPILVEHSGVQSTSHRAATDERDAPPNSATWKRGREEGKLGQILDKIKEMRGLMEALPIRGLTLVNVWAASQCLFAVCMMMTW